MNKKAHVYFGLALGTSFTLLGFHPFFSFLSAIVGQVLPDIDTIKGHRKFAHNIFIPILFMLLGNEFLALIGVSWLFHIALDALTVGTLYVLFPLSNVAWQGVLKNNSFFEKLICVLSFAFVLIGGVFVLAAS